MEDVLFAVFVIFMAMVVSFIFYNLGYDACERDKADPLKQDHDGQMESDQ